MAFSSALSATMHCPSRHTLTRELSLKFTTMQDALRLKLQEQMYLCTTADVWSTRHRSFLGIAIHWVSNKRT